MYRICLTGHRPKDLVAYMNGANPYDYTNAFWTAARQVFDRLIADQLAHHPNGLELHSGLALGADTVWALAIISARQKFGADRIQFVADVPLMTQASHWTRAGQQLWQHLVDAADRVDVTSDGPYQPCIMELRNQQMIFPSDVCIAFWNGKDHGDTFNGVIDAASHHVPILHVDPRCLWFLLS